MAQHQMVQIVRFAITRTVIAIILRHSCSFQHLTTTTFPHQVPLFELGRLHFIARFAHSFLTALLRNVQHVLLVTIILPPIFLALFLPSCRPNCFQFRSSHGFQRVWAFSRSPANRRAAVAGRCNRRPLVIAAFHITNQPFVVQCSLIMLQLSSRKMAVAT